MHLAFARATKILKRGQGSRGNDFGNPIRHWIQWVLIVHNFGFTFLWSPECNPHISCGPTALEKSVQLGCCAKGPLREVLGFVFKWVISLYAPTPCFLTSNKIKHSFHFWTFSISLNFACHLQYRLVTFKKRISFCMSNRCSMKSLCGL